MRGATAVFAGVLYLGLISIHAPHAGSDAIIVLVPCDSAISIHAPHAGSDTVDLMCITGDKDFNPRSPCGERR